MKISKSKRENQMKETQENNHFRIPTSFLLIGVCVSLTSPVIAAKWFEVEQEDRVVTVGATGTVESANELSVGVPATDSWRLRLGELVEEGTRVRKGTTLFSIESSSQQRDLEQLEGQLQVRKGEVETNKERNLQVIEQEKLDLANLESEADKANRRAELPASVVPGIEYKKLVEQKRLANILYQRGLTRKEMSERSRELEKEALDRQIKRLEADIEQRKQEMASFTVRSTIEGLAIVGVGWQGEKLQTGDRVGPGRPVVTVVDDSNILVRGVVREQAAARLAVGQRAIVESDALAGSELVGKLTSVGNTVRRKSQRSPIMVRDFTVEFDEDYSHILDLKTSVHVIIEVDVQEGALAVPKEALVYREGKPGVVTSREWTPVELGNASGSFFIVLGGLNAGDKVRL